MSGSHVNLPALDLEREQSEISALIASLQHYKPSTRSTSDSNSSNSNSTTPKSAPVRNGRGRQARSKDVPVPSSPVVHAADALCPNSFELIIECLNKLNSQNQKLISRVTELDAVVQEQNKTIETLEEKVNSGNTTDSSTSDIPAPSKELYSTVVKRVEKIEENLNSHLLLCRGPAVTNKITSSTVNGIIDLEKIKAEICAEVCGETVTNLSVSALGLSIYGKNRNLLKIECSSVNVRNHLLEQARKRKPVGIYLAEFLSTEKLKLHRRVNELKREFPNKVKAVYVRRGDIYYRTEPDGEVIRINNDESADDLRRQFCDSPVTTDNNGAAVA